MTKIYNWLSVIGAIIYIASYLVLYNQLGFEISKFIADLIALTGLAFMSASTSPVAWAAFKNGIKTGRDRLIFSYWLLFTIIMLQRIYIIGYNRLGRPDELTYSVIPGLIAVMVGIASAYGASAPVTGDVTLQRKEILTFIISAGIAGIVMGTAIGVFVVSGWQNI